MQPSHFLPMPLLHLNIISISFSFLFFLLLLAIPSSHSQKETYDPCMKPFKCGSLEDLSYPFWGGKWPASCGQPSFELKCQEGEYPLLAKQPFRVLNVNQFSKIMTIARDDYFSNETCSQENPPNTTLATSILAYDPNGFVNISIFYNCTSYITGFVPVSYRFRCSIHGDGLYVDAGFLSNNSYLASEVMRNCKVRVEVPVQRDVLARRLEKSNNVSVDLLGVLRQGFIVSYDDDCLANIRSGGSCAYDGRVYSPSFSTFAGQYHINRRLVIGLLFGPIPTLIILSIIIDLYKLKGNKENDVDIRTFIKNCGALAMKRYHFKEIKKMTNSFKDKLGEGGFGSVYKGKLFDGRPVAIKVLKASKGNGTEFLNEVASISRTSHVNIVTLLGYCFEYDKRVLIYEFMPNGSLDKFIQDKITCSILEPQLEWKKLLEIAIGVARGLEYLHRGCNTRIVHFDIKPHNILLDDDFCPKISDFGLAKFSNARESIISMLEARGTIGYIAPEVFNRNFGGVSSKSDVYSYGMLLLDIVGARQKDRLPVDDVSGSSNYYFPHWIYKQIELEKYEFSSSLTMEEVEVVKRMTLVGLWCIQTIPSSRPAINQVIEMLEGNMKLLETPPKPFFFSPPRLQLPSSTTSSRSVEIARLICP